MADELPKVKNINVASLYRLMNRTIKELHSSSSAGVEWVRAPDLKRLNSYLDRYEKEVTFAAGISDNWDWPQTKDFYETLEAPEPYTEVENEYANYALSYLNRWRTETLLCQSAEQSQGLKPSDKAREDYNLKAMRDWISKVVEPTQPMDYPASSPQELDAGGKPL